MNTPPARPPTRLYDWKRDKLAAAELVRPYPPIAGSGRGELLEVVEARRKMQGQQLTREQRPA